MLKKKSRDVVKDVDEVRSNVGQSANYHDRDQCRHERVLDCRCTTLITPKYLELLHIGLLVLFIISQHDLIVSPSHFR